MSQISLEARIQQYFTWTSVENQIFFAVQFHSRLKRKMFDKLYSNSLGFLWSFKWNSNEIRPKKSCFHSSFEKNFTEKNNWIFTWISNTKMVHSSFRWYLRDRITRRFQEKIPSKASSEFWSIQIEWNCSEIAPILVLVLV